MNNISVCTRHYNTFPIYLLIIYVCFNVLLSTFAYITFLCDNIFVCEMHIACTELGCANMNTFLHAFRMSSGISKNLDVYMKSYYNRNSTLLLRKILLNAG